MPTDRLIAILLLVAGVLALGYGGFSYTQETHKMEVGPMHISVDEKKRVNIPVWAGAGAVLIGGVLLVMRRGS